MSRDYVHVIRHPHTAALRTGEKYGGIGSGGKWSHIYLTKKKHILDLKICGGIRGGGCQRRGGIGGGASVLQQGIV